MEIFISVGEKTFCQVKVNFVAYLISCFLTKKTQNQTENIPEIKQLQSFMPSSEIFW